MTEAQIAELAARQELRRVHGTYGRIFEDLDLVLAALRAEREARERAERELDEARAFAEEARANFDHVTAINRTWAETAKNAEQRAEAAERELAAVRRHLSAVDAALGRSQYSSRPAECYVADMAKRAATAEEAVLVLHGVLTLLLNDRVPSPGPYRDDTTYALPVRVGDLRAATAAMKHPAVLAVMQRQEPENG